jgi:hypothetical protein
MAKRTWRWSRQPLAPGIVRRTNLSSDQMEGFVLRCPLVLTFHAPHENTRPYRATSEIVALAALDRAAQNCLLSWS